MSDQKRANLITVDGSKKTKQKVTKTIRIALDLFESNEKECPEFNYKELVRAEEGRRRAEKEKKGGAPNGLRDPFSDNDEDVERIAKQFEQKYGGTSTYGSSKGRCKQDDYADIGAGYDENDSFIDNTDGYDEMIPPECDTVCGGFYINSGSLEFKNITGVGTDLGDSSPPSHRRTNKRALSSSGSDDDSSSSDGESDASTGEKQARSDGDGREQNGNGKTSNVTDSDKSGEDGKKSKPAKVKDMDGKDGLPKKKRKNSVDEIPSNHEPPAPVTPSVNPKQTVREILAEARAKVGMENCIVEASTDCSSDSSHKAPAVPSSDNPISSDSSRDVAPPTAHPCAPLVAPLPPLPPELPPEAALLARRLRAMADAHFSSHTGKLSGAEVNEIILGMEKHCRRGSVPPSVRQALFSHAAALLRRGKAGLIQRARRLADQQMRTSHTSSNPLDRLKGIIEKMKPALLENYKTESQKIMELNKQIVFQNSTLDDDKKIPEKRLPKRRFSWNDQVRSLLSDLVKGQGLSDDEEATARYLHGMVLPLFPSGFVRMPTLLQQAKLGKTPKSFNDSGKTKLLSKSLDLKQVPSSQQPPPLNKSSSKMSIAEPVKFSQAERSISDPEPMAPIHPRPRPLTSSICIGTDLKEPESKILDANFSRNNISPNQIDPDKKSFIVHGDGRRSASPMIGDNVSISVTSVFQKKSDPVDLKTSPSPPKTDKYLHPNSNSSLTITPVSATTSKDGSKNSLPTKVSNSVTITPNQLLKPLEINATTVVASHQQSVSPGSIKVKSNNALFGKTTLAKIISGKNSHDPVNSKLDGSKDGHRVKTHSDHTGKSGEKNVAKVPHISTGLDFIPKSSNSMPTSPLPMLSKAYLGSSEAKLSSEDFKSHVGNNDMFVKPKYKTEHSSSSSSHHQRPSNSIPLSPTNYHKSADMKISDKYQNEIHKLPHNERNSDTLNVSPISKHIDHPPMSSSTPAQPTYVLKQHRIQKKYDALAAESLNSQKESHSGSHRDGNVTQRDGNVTQRDGSVSQRDGNSLRDSSSQRDGNSQRDSSSQRDGNSHRDSSSQRESSSLRDASCHREGNSSRESHSSSQKLNFGVNSATSKSSRDLSLNLDDSSSDDCVEIVSEDNLSQNKAITSVLRDDDVKRREIIRQEVEKQYRLLNDKPFEKVKSDFSIKSIVNDAYSVKNILKSSHDAHDVKKHIDQSNPQSVIHGSSDSVLKYPRKTPEPDEEPEPKKYKLDILGDSEPNSRNAQSFSGDNAVKCEAVSVIKDNFLPKSDRFMERMHIDARDRSASFEEKEAAMDQELDVNTVMQNIKSLQDLQMCSSDALPIRPLEEASNTIFRAGHPTTIFNNQNFVSNENLLKKQSHFMETTSSHNLTTGSLH